MQLAQEEGLRRPQADAGNRHERTRDLVIGERAHGLQVDEPGLLPAGKFQQAAGFGVRQADCPQPRRAQGQQGTGIGHCPGSGRDPVVNGERGCGRDPLPGDMEEHCGELARAGTPAVKPLERVRATVGASEARQHGFSSRQGLVGGLPGTACVAGHRISARSGVTKAAARERRTARRRRWSARRGRPRREAALRLRPRSRSARRASSALAGWCHHGW